MKKFIISFTLLIGVLSLWSCQQSNSQPAILYIDVIKVYDQFQMKEELGNKLISEQKRIKLEQDSIELALTNLDLSQNLNKEQVERYRSLVIKNQNYLQDMQGRFDQSISERINKYATEYSKENNLEMLLGANGSGNILFAKPERDITTDFISFINSKYNAEED